MAAHWRTLPLSTFLSRCPACGEGHIFAGWLQLQDLCPVCGVRFERWPGAWTGPVVMAYTSGALAAVVPGWWLFTHGGLQDHHGLLIAGFAAAASLASLRQCKGTWLWLLHATGWIYRDDAPIHLRRSAD